MVENAVTLEVRAEKARRRRYCPQTVRKGSDPARAGQARLSQRPPSPIPREITSFMISLVPP